MLWPKEIVERWSLEDGGHFEQNLQFALETMIAMLRHEAFQDRYSPILVTGLPL